MTAYDDAWAQVRAVKNTLKAIQADAAANFLANQTTVRGLLTENPEDDLLTTNWLASTQRGYTGFLSANAVERAFTGPMRNLMRAINQPVGTFRSSALVLRDYMAANSHTIKQPTNTYNNITGGGASQGRLYRVTDDKYGNTLGGNAPETKTIECSDDKLYQEIFRFSGQTADTTAITRGGSGLKNAPQITTKTPKATEALITNPQWQLRNAPTTLPTTDADLTAATDITGWVVDDHTKFAVTAQTDRIYGGALNTALPTGVVFKGINGSITQDLRTNVNPVFDDEYPYYATVAVYRPSGVDGQITFTLGNKVLKSLALTSLTADTVSLIDLKHFYFREINQTDIGLTVAVTTQTTAGNLTVSALNMVKMQRVDGHYYALFSGPERFKRGDAFALTDTAVVLGELYEWFVVRSGLAAQGIVLPTDNPGTIAD